MRDAPGEHLVAAGPPEAALESTWSSNANRSVRARRARAQAKLRRFFVVLSFAALAAFAMLTSARSARAGEHRDDDDVAISLLTFGPGDHPFSKFGHAALLVDDGATSLVYNYGTFAFDSWWLIPKFLMGKYHYWLSVQRLDRTLAVYAAENRSVASTPLRLAPNAKRELLAFLQWNARDENKSYVFDYYRDNCATRVRDIVDKASGGALRASSQAPASMTWRQHTMRLSADSLWVYAGLYMAMGPLIDQPIARWDEMFLPAKLADVTVAAGLAAATPLTLVSAHRQPAASEPPRWTGRIAVFAIAAGALMAALGVMARRGSRIARGALGASAAGLGLVLGLCGVLFVFLWVCTNHAVAYRNENILQCAPWALGLVGAGYRYARRYPGAATSLWRAARLVWVTSVLGALMKLTALGVQENGQVIALTLPMWSGLALAAYWAARRAAPRNSGPAGAAARLSRAAHDGARGVA